jgi:hypothetical protein
MSGGATIGLQLHQRRSAHSVAGSFAFGMASAAWTCASDKLTGRLDVRFRSEADISSAQRHGRLVPEAVTAGGP